MHGVSDVYVHKLRGVHQVVSRSRTLRTNLSTSASRFFLSPPVRSSMKRLISASSQRDLSEKSSAKRAAGSGESEEGGRYWIVERGGGSQMCKPCRGATCQQHL